MQPSLCRSVLVLPLYPGHRTPLRTRRRLMRRTPHCLSDAVRRVVLLPSLVPAVPYTPPLSPFFSVPRLIPHQISVLVLVVHCIFYPQPPLHVGFLTFFLIMFPFQQTPSRLGRRLTCRTCHCRSAPARGSLLPAVVQLQSSRLCCPRVSYPSASFRLPISHMPLHLRRFSSPL
jgi:hypothetical protein